MRLARSRLSDKQTERLLESFVAATPARLAAEWGRVNRNTARLFYHRLREIIAQHLASAAPVEGELDAENLELIDGAGGSPPPAAAGEVPLFGLLRRGDKVYAVMLSTAHRVLPGAWPRGPKHDSNNHHHSRPHGHRPNHRKERMKIDALVYAAMPRLGTALNVADMRQVRGPLRQAASHDLLHIDRIDDFWERMKWHLRRFHGVPRQHFYLFLKECEWRYNYGTPERLAQTLVGWIEGHEPAAHLR